MTQKQIPIEKALELVEFKLVLEKWTVENVKCDVEWNVEGDVRGSVMGGVWGNVQKNVMGSVGGTINGREWQFVETPREKLKRLIEEGAGKAQLLEAFNQLEDI